MTTHLDLTAAHPCHSQQRLGFSLLCPRNVRMFVSLCADVSPVSPPGSSGDSEDCVIGSQGLCVPTQKSYSSSETLKAFDQHQDQTRWGPRGKYQTSSQFSLRAPCLILPSAQPRKSFWSIRAASDGVSTLFISALRSEEEEEESLRSRERGYRRGKSLSEVFNPQTSSSPPPQCQVYHCQKHSSLYDTKVPRPKNSSNT